MRKDIEKQFLKAYKFGGVVHDCIEVLRYEFNLGFTPDAYKNPSNLMKNLYNEILPNRIKEKTEAFDESVITIVDSPLIEEIDNNLSECKTIQEKERYIHTLIVPFKELSDLLYPELAIKKRIENELFENEKDRKYWSDIKDFNNVIINDKTLTTKQAKKLVNDNLQAIDNLAIEKKEQYNRLNMISEHFHKIIGKPNNEVEKILSKFNKLKFMFANRLDALCLNNNIDFIKLQNEVEIYLKHRRRIEDIYIYIGTWEQTEKYINELHIQKNDKEPIQQTKEKSQIPPPLKELKQEQIKKLELYFTSQFKGIGNNPNNFENLLIPELNMYVNHIKAKDCARIAAIIYDSIYFKQTNLPTYNKWLNDFYDIMGIKTKTMYKRNVLKNEKKFNELRKKFSYLYI